MLSNGTRRFSPSSPSCRRRLSTPITDTTRVRCSRTATSSSVLPAAQCLESELARRSCAATIRSGRRHSRRSRSTREKKEATRVGSKTGSRSGCTPGVLLQGQHELGIPSVQELNEGVYLWCPLLFSFSERPLTKLFIQGH
ncbi:hypothetical protein CH063_06816 [Colletotrichum higginsianum]|uniref:Uncharacterized protein n=1 Tax=Colletotrichum higginsianum (strain IMI 349063) TaxID=759273 RepID=H1V3V9_COLHI|nr:hypothetical protein CH063_06816 [Colletotrichum higginsianum]